MIIILLIIFVIIAFRLKKDILIYLPIVSIVIDLSFSFFQGSGQTTLGISVPAIFRFVIYLIIISSFITRLNKAKYPKFYWLFLIYIFILCLFSTDIFVSFKNYLQLALTMMMFPIGYLYFTDENKIKKFFSYSKYALGIYVISLILGNFFNVGTREFTYSGIEDSVGFFSSGSVFAGSVMVALLPVFLYFDQTKKKKFVTLILGSLFIIGVLFTARRTSILIPFIGLFVFMFFSKMKLRVTLIFTFGAIIFVILAPFFMTELTERLAVRAESGKFDINAYESEGRYFDLVNAWDQATNFDKPYEALFGANIFAEGGWRYGVRIGRMIHNDYAVFLQGSGIIGLTLYMILILSIFFMVKNKHSVKRRFRYNVFHSSMISLILILLVVSINGGYNIMSYRSILFLLLGAFVRLVNFKEIRRVPNNYMKFKNTGGILNNSSYGNDNVRIKI